MRLPFPNRRRRGPRRPAAEISIREAREQAWLALQRSQRLHP